MFHVFIAVFIALIIGTCIHVFGGTPAIPHQVLVVAADDNIKSNFYYEELIATEMGIKVDSLHYYFNGTVAAALIEHSDAEVQYIHPATEYELTEKIEVTGEGDESAASVKGLPIEAYRALLDKNKADYLLVINQHYLKKIEASGMNTLFHIVSFSLFDHNRNEVKTVYQNYSLIKLAKAEKMVPLIEKTSTKIASRINRIIQ